MDCPEAQTVSPGTQPVALGVREEHFHHYAESILAHHVRIRTDLTAAIESVSDVEFRPTAAGRFGVNTQTENGLNHRLRVGFVGQGWRSEIGWTDELPEAIWVFHPTDPFKTGASVSEKFDIASLDEHANARRIWNILAEGRRLSDGQQALLGGLAPSRLKAHWDGDCFCLLEEVRSAIDVGSMPKTVSTGVWSSRSYGDLLAHSDVLPRLDAGPRQPTVLGEIQFGNWALAYRDVGRILAVRQKFSDSPVDLFIIAVATGCLAQFISEGTVNFAQSRRTLERVGPDLPVPTWLVGIDFRHGVGLTHPSLVPS